MMSGRSRPHSHSDENSMGSHEGYISPMFVLEHLATFTVSQENDLLYPADGMRRLLTMEKTNGIWTQRMLMKIERNMINIMDNENKEIVERFPIRLVREPTAFTSSDPKELYNNILIYIVGHTNVDNPNISPAEMHIFQCVNVRARDVVEVLKSCMIGKHHGNNQQQQKSWQSSDYKMDTQMPPYEDVDVDPIRAPKMMLSQSEGDDASSTSSDHFEHDVKILNCCFDDIEKFVARLQHSAAAFRELEKRRRSRRSKRKDLGDGMLSVRAKPPSEREFVDIFQKFKLSFNLLAKLKSHIHDPNAPELIHFLFTPLALIVDASHDSHYGPNLAAKVIAPLLTPDSIDLLINCLTSKESELWNMLGEAWFVPEHEWKGYVPPFHPFFSDGWSPKTLDNDDNIDNLQQPDIDEVDQPSVEVYRSDLENDITTMPLPPPGMLRTNGRTRGPFTERILREEFDNGHHEIELEDEQQIQDPWAMNLIHKGCRVAQVTHPRTANNDKELTVIREEFLEILDDSRKWWKVRNSRGHIGHVPHTIVTLHEGVSLARPTMAPRMNKQPHGSSTGRRGELRYF